MKDYATQFVGRVGRVTAIVGVLIVVTALTAAVVVGIRLFSSDEYTITAQFPATPGLYHDNDVDILGVPSGHVVKVTPKAKYVEVVLTLPASVKIPADAKAVVMAPNPVSDRFIELTPPYTKGPKLKAGAVLGLDRTVVPLEIDQVFASLSTISRQLGPSGANKKGALSAALHAFAGLADGNGQHLHDAIGKIAAALPALTAHPDDLRRLIDGLDSLTTKLVSRNDTINHLYDDLAKTTGQFADDRAVLSSAISNLQRGLAQVAVFIKANQSRLGTAVKGLNVTMAAILSQQKSLIQTFDIAPLGFQNFNRAIDPNTPVPERHRRAAQLLGAVGPARHHLRRLAVRDEVLRIEHPAAARPDRQSKSGPGQGIGDRHRLRGADRPAVQPARTTWLAQARTSISRTT